MVHIGSKLKYLIEKKRLSKKVMAKELNMTEANFYRILGKEHLRTDLLIEFCKRLDVHPCDFFKDWEHPNPEVNMTNKVFANDESVVHEDDHEYFRPDIFRRAEKLYRELLDEKDSRIVELKDHISSLKDRPAN